MYHIFGCPMHFGVGDKGLIHSLDYLNSYCKNLDMTLLQEITMPEENLPNLKNLNSVIATCTQIAEHSYTALHRGDTPLFIAGDHSSVIGSISAAGSYYDNLGLIWIDAHPDINTDATTVTGNIHGMPVAALLGMGEQRLTQILSDRPKLKASNIVMLGLRDIDPPEADFLKELNIKYYTYEETVHLGIQHCLDECIAHLSGLEHVHISFDVDVMDPSLLPGVSVPVPEGFKEPEAFLIMDELMNRLPISSYDIVEFNAEHDRNDETAEFVRKMIHRILSQNRLEILRNEIDKIILNEKSDHIRMYISHMYGVARFCTLLAMKRNLNIELATTCGMLHDIFYMSGGTSDNHAAKGAEQAETILKAMRLYSDDEIKIVTNAISRHSDKKHIHEPYDELLKDADVLDHCLYNTAFPIAQHETERYSNLLIELGITGVK